MKRIFSTLSEKWPEYVLEIMVITAGILGAFALNSWNDNRKISASEQVILSNLKDELIANQSAFEQNEKQHQKAMGSTIELLKLFGTDISKVPTQHLDTLLYRAESYFTFEPVDGYMSSIISSGKLDHIRNEKLKSMITGFEGKVIDTSWRMSDYGSKPMERLASITD